LKVSANVTIAMQCFEIFGGRRFSPPVARRDWSGFCQQETPNCQFVK